MSLGQYANLHRELMIRTSSKQKKYRYAFSSLAIMSISCHIQRKSSFHYAKVSTMRLLNGKAIFLKICVQFCTEGYMKVICLVSSYYLYWYSRQINMIVIKMTGIKYVWFLTSLLNLSVTFALDLKSRTSHNIDCRKQTTFIEWKSILQLLNLRLRIFIYKKYNET